MTELSDLKGLTENAHLIPDVADDADFNRRVGNLNQALLYGGSGIAGLALGCILYQDRLIHSLREELETVTDQEYR